LTVKKEKPRTTKDTKYHEGFDLRVLLSCNFVSFVVLVVKGPTLLSLI